MNKKIMCCLLTAAFVLGVSGCSSQTEESSEVSTEIIETTTTAAVTTTTETTEETTVETEPEYTGNNPYGDLKIGYAEGDVALCVRHDLKLPAKMGSTDITWKSSDESVVKPDGTVIRPAERSCLVTLTATLTVDGEEKEKDFEVRVIKTANDHLTPDDIYINDEPDQIYFYNDIIEDCKIYVNKKGYVTRVIGSIIDFKVDSPEDALLAIHGIHKLIGCENVFEELKIDHIIKDDTCYYFVFNQVHNSFPVNGIMLTLTTDLEGNTNGFINYYVPIDISTDPAVDKDAAIAAIGDYEKIFSEELMIDIDGEKATLIWKSEYSKAGEAITYSAKVDAQTGKLIWSRQNVIVD